jgi:hypothetical protein
MPDLVLGSTITVKVPDPLPVVVVDAPPDLAGAVVVPVAGPPGPTGPSGTGFVYHQTAPASSWPVTHNLNTKPWVHTVLDGDSGEASIPDVQYLDANSLLVEFPSPVTGYAYM